MAPPTQLKPAEEFSVLAEEQSTYQSSRIRSAAAIFGHHGVRVTFEDVRRQPEWKFETGLQELWAGP